MDLVPPLHRTVGRARQLRALARVRTSARLARVDLDLDVAPSARIGRIDVRFAPGVPARFHVGANTVLDDGVEVRFTGGSLRIGEWCEIRGGTRFMVGGELQLVGQNLLSWGAVVHCNEAVTLQRQATFGEYVTIADSTHVHRDDGWHLDQLSTAPVTVGADTWVGAKATITRGVTMGDHCTVAAGAVVTRDVPDDHVAVGIPAQNRPRTAASPGRP